MWRKLQEGTIIISLQVQKSVKKHYFYINSDCALDETCVLCEKCFVYDVHKDHNFWYTIGSDRNGSCDCGEEDSWRNELCCPRHSSQVSSLSDFSIQNYSSDSLSFSSNILSYILESILTYCSKAKFDEDQSIIILYNDESHSFDDVIEILTSSLEITTEEASIVAKLVDSKVMITLEFRFYTNQIKSICRDFVQFFLHP